MPSAGPLVRVVALSVAAIAGSGARVSAQLHPLGGEIQVNAYTSGDQKSAAVAATAAGGFVVVWQSLGSFGGDLSYEGILAQRYGADGSPLGAELQVNSYSPSRQRFPAVRSDALGQFVVVWQSAGSAGGDTSQTSVQGQLFDPGGVPLAGEFQVNSYTTGDQAYPAVAMGAGGDFLVVWESSGSAGGDSSGRAILAQRFDASGLPAGGELQVNSYVTGNQGSAAAAPSGDGFAVVWASEGSNGGDTSGASIQGQLYDGAGAPLGDEFQVNAYTTATQQMPAIGADAQGNFVVAWESDGSPGSDSSGYSIQAQRYLAEGTPVGPQIQVNEFTPGSQRAPAVAVTRDGGFVVSWASYGSAGGDSSLWSIQGQRFDAAGAALGTQFQVNSYTTGSQFRPSLAAGRGSDFVVAWSGAGSAGTDTSAYSVHAQRYGCLFCDDFESGDSARWSATIP
jgi:hypothetical protein